MSDTTQPAAPALPPEEAAALTRIRQRLAAQQTTAAAKKPDAPQPADFVAEAEKLFRRIGEKAEARHAGRPIAPLYPPAPTAAEVRKGWYIPKRFRRCVLDLCPRPVDGRCRCIEAAHYVAHTPSQRAAQRAAAAWAERCGTGEGIALALVGGVGTGKSHLMYAAVARANDRGINAGAWGWGDLADILRGTSDRDPDVKKAAGETRLRLKAVAAMGIDEIRDTSSTGYDGTTLSNLMTRAYRECQDVIVTSNHAGADLQAIIGLAATSRLTPLTVIGPDYRQKVLTHAAA